MTQNLGEREAHSKLDLIESIADDVRRSALRELRTRRGDVDVKELATVTAATVTGRDLAEVTPDERDAVHWRLVHTHLHKLVEGGLVEWDDEAGTVRTSNHPVLGDERFERLLTTDAEDWDAVLTAVQSERRRFAVVELADAGTLDRATLARRVTARERGVATSAVPAAAVEDARVSLHHVHAPILADAGLVSVDDGEISYEGHDEFDSQWLSVASEDISAERSADGDDELSESEFGQVELAVPSSGAPGTPLGNTSPNSS